MLAEQACPRCKARYRPDAPWCTQCYLDLRPAAPLPEVAERVPAASVADRTWPCTGCGTANPWDLVACESCGLGFLAAVHSQTPPLLVLPVVGDLAALRPAIRVALAMTVIAVVVLLTFLLGVLP